MRYLFFIPALIYLALLAINLSIFSASTEINFFWLARFDIPVVIFISIFFIFYIILIWAGFNFSTAFSNAKNKKTEKENFELKNKLLSKQWDLIWEIESKFQNIFDQQKAAFEKQLESYKKENEKVVSNVQYDFKTLSDKMDKVIKSK